MQHSALAAWQNVSRWYLCCVKVMIAGVNENHLLAWKNASWRQTNIMFFIMNDEFVLPPGVWFLKSHLHFFFALLVRCHSVQTFRKHFISIWKYHKHIINMCIIHNIWHWPPGGLMFSKKYLLLDENSCIKVKQATIQDSAVEIKQKLHHALCMFPRPPWLQCLIWVLLWPEIRPLWPWQGLVLLCHDASIAPCACLLPGPKTICCKLC